MTLCPLRRTAAHLKGGLHPELGTRKVTLKGLRRTQCPGGLGQLHYWIEMTTATPLGGTTFFSLNVTTREEDFLYKSSGAIVAAIVVIVIVIFTVVLILLKMYNSAGALSPFPRL
ncbi:noncompact myelin-associated protein isoform X2 [Ursus americanus]|uniref:noncompact myelin-associated protein isoform X2 n=1 Tax=Ursus americanus TaxID=9643 RepID=UPI000E6DEE49|nr:noncompact myelin-associated protein isoform X2 [Ursus americanus]